LNLRIILFGDLDIDRLVKRDDKIQKIHRVDLDLNPERLARVGRLALEVGRNRIENLGDKLGQFRVSRKSSGISSSCARRMRNCAARRPPLTR
jgi:hypothetical protein